LIHTLDSNTEEASFIPFSPNGLQILTRSRDWQTGGVIAKIWDAETGQMVHSLGESHDAIYFAMPSPDGMHVLTGSEDGTVKLFESQTGKLLHSYKWPSGLIRSAIFPRGEPYVLTTAKDNKVQLWSFFSELEVSVDGQDSLSSTGGQPQ
jgi:WD40 repeat protein